MKLITKQIEKNFAKYPLGSQGGVDNKKTIIAKFFGGCACTWYITEASREDDDWMMFGYCDLGLGFPEWGYVSFNELAKLKFPPFGLPVERDFSYDKMQYTIDQHGNVEYHEKKEAA